MSSKEEIVLQGSLSMKGGDGIYSYAKNSSFQRKSADVVREKIDEAIAEKLDMKSLCSRGSRFHIADFGCSTGPNTFIAMQNILESIERKYQSQCPTGQIPEFQVFFNDQVSNDFNTLFTTLPLDRKYFVAGVPGPFHGRLFPASSLHFAYSSTALHWLSKVPEVLLDKNSPSFNKGRIYCTSTLDKVVDAYSSQFAKDIKIFLEARAKELVAGGMLVMIMPAKRNENPHCQTGMGMCIEYLESSFLDMVNEGIISEAKVDSFNLPLYEASLEEMMELIQRNGSFNIEKMELTTVAKGESTFENYSPYTVQMLKMHMRAGLEEIISKHFGTEIIDDLFDRYAIKLENLFHRLQSGKGKGTQMFVILKRK
ncbi:unnamed protein product [Dovyalis caffra]|uniref:S-adenosylmethionine-dependent methyltransferase At5g38100 n=1 Tax=Dovyalis caffra TaxID=77055 RepID=A0AAV1R1D7_9ROSI|nr:unnamed protein product [Dovyalis caffra]